MKALTQEEINKITQRVDELVQKKQNDFIEASHCFCNNWPNVNKIKARSYSVSQLFADMRIEDLKTQYYQMKGGRISYVTEQGFNKILNALDDVSSK